MERADLNNDLNRIFDLEVSSFPSDEAASYESIQYRLKNAPEYFVVMKQNKEIVGFINGTCTLFDYITHSSMTSHNPDGKTLILHSVTIDEKFRRKKIGSDLLTRYVNMLVYERLEISLLLLLSKSYLLNFYKSCGFTIKKLSDVNHGKVKFQNYLKVSYALSKYPFLL